MNDSYDFCGWATRNDIRCSDGRTIRRDAFAGNDGQIVPLVWNHKHDDVRTVLGHALLENRPEGVYAYATFNDTPYGKHGKEMVKNGDIGALSIYANQLKHAGKDVIHGVIREVSLVMAGANPEAKIENILCHSSVDEYDESGVFFVEMNDELEHSEGEDMEENQTIQDVLDTMDEDQLMAVYAIVEALTNGEDTEEVKHSALDEDGNFTIEDVIETLDDTQLSAVNALIDEVLDELSEELEGELEEMKHNVFDNDTQETSLMHADDVAAIFNDARTMGSLRAAVENSALAHGIDDIDVLFPEAKDISNEPDMIAREQEWVKSVMNSVHKTPFARVRSMVADITGAEARARGYIKGNLKKEEVLNLLKRTTDPHTIYKKQSLHRDDLIDITSFDVVAWLKAEMRLMMNEEVARAILIGDGRLAGDDKIDETHIRPVHNDHDLYTVKKVVTYPAAATTPEDKAKHFIKEVIRARKDYKGTGNPVLYTTEDMITDMLLIEDKNERIIYDDIAKLVRTLRVKDIVSVPVMENVKGAKGGTLLGVMVNLTDYNVGTNKGGELSFFDDFDLNYNKQLYLMETRMSGALTKPFAAVAFETADAFVPNPDEGKSITSKLFPDDEE